MDYTLADTQRKEKLLKTVYTLQVKSDTTFQKASPLLSTHRGLGMVTEYQVHQLAEKTKVICHDLDNIKNHLYYRQDDLVQQIPNPNGSHYGGVSGIHCALDGTIYITSENAPRVHFVNRPGQVFQTLPCLGSTKKETFLPEDVTLTRSGMVAVTDMLNGTIHIFNSHSKFSKGEWVRIGTFCSPRGIGVDALGRILVTDYTEGKVHSFTLDHDFKVQNIHSISNLHGPRYVCSDLDGGFVVSEECGDVKLFSSSSQKYFTSISSKYNHHFGNPAGVCADREGNIIVADEQHRKIHLFPRNGSPICLVSKGLQRPTGVACSTQGLLLVADTGENWVKIFKYRVRPHYNSDFLCTSGDNLNLIPKGRTE